MKYRCKKTGLVFRIVENSGVVVLSVRRILKNEEDWWVQLVTDSKQKALKQLEKWKYDIEKI